MNRFKFYFSLITLSLVAFNVLAQEKIIVLNEGNWQSDNGKITYFENNAVVSNQWFRDKNGSKLGDTPNDIIQINSNLLAIAINWSNIVQFITPEGKAVAATEDIPNNRKLATDGAYVYVTSYAHECGNATFTKGFVAKIDVNTYKVINTCEVGYEPEGIVYYSGYLFVANSGGYAASESHDYESTISIIDAKTMTKVRDIDTKQINLCGSMSRSGKYICVGSAGDYYSVSASTVILDCDKALNGNSDCFVVLDMASTSNCTMLDGKFLSVGAQYSYLTSGYKFEYVTIDPASVMESSGAEGINETLPGTVQSDLTGMDMPYDVYVNPYTGYIYATDAASFAEGGLLYQWSPEGKLLGKHRVYINPAHILALPPNGVFGGINNLVRDFKSADDSYYNLQGIRVIEPRNGIYINKGKKIFIK